MNLIGFQGCNALNVNVLVLKRNWTNTDSFAEEEAMRWSKDQIRDLVEKIIDWFLFVVLLIAAFALVQDVWGQYASKKTSMTWEEVPITELPTLTLCFGNQIGTHWYREMHDLGTEFNVTYFLNET